ncbi:MAG TPA: hypothetical protein VMN82_04740 [Thermoanaerobaculia bacterium]|nr:hypothetical protein [Thermoanaerobaculia bacterium]
MRTRTAAILLGAAVVAFVLRHPVELALLRHRATARPDVSGEPVQTAEERAPFEHAAGRERYRIVPRYRWDESARVVGEEPYRFGAAGSLIPKDLALAWGPLLAPPYAGRVSFSQGARFFFWRTKDASLDRGTIVSHCANTHVIPATSRLARALGGVSEGDDVRLEGWLVDVEGISDPSFRWTTSTTRTDEGPNSCETVYLERLTINERVYE